MATTTAPPSYTLAQAEADLKRITSTITDAQKAKVNEAIAAEFDKPQTASNLLTEVRALGSSLIMLDAAFNRVTIELGTVDNNNYKDKNGNPIAKFQPEWRGFHERFKVMLWASRDTASRTAAYVKDFKDALLPTIEQVLPMLDITKPGFNLAIAAQIQQALHVELENFWKNNNNPATQPTSTVVGTRALTVSEKQAQDFRDLQQAIQAFQAKFASFASDESTNLNSQLMSVTNEIATIKLEIEGYTKVINGLGIAVGVTAVGTVAGAIGAAACFGPLGLATAIGVIIVGIAAVISELGVLIAWCLKRNDAEDRLATANARKTSLEAQLATLQSLKKKLEAQSADINDICTRLGKMSEIWGMVAFDAQGVDSALTNAVNNQSWLTLLSRINLLKSAYANLYAAPQTYATCVDTYGIPAPAKTT